MAVTIHSQPGTHTPGYNEQYFVASSSNSNQTGFRYVVAVTVGSDTITERINKRPDNGQLYFDPSKIVQSYLDKTFETTLDVPDYAEDSIIYVTVGITEEYGSPVSGFAGASGSYYAWNAAYTVHDFKEFVYSGASSVALDLTLAPSYTDTININHNYLYKIWHKGFSTNTLYWMYIEAWDTSGLPVMLQSATIRTQFTNYADYRQNLVMANIAPTSLNRMELSLPAGYVNKITNPGGDVIPSNTSYYTVTWQTSGGTQASNTYTVNINSMCYKYDRYVLYFLNRLGNYDSFTFNLLNRKTSEKKTSEYKKNPFVNVSNDLVYVLDSSDTSTYSTTITNKITLNSDWITDAQAIWLKELFMSPSVLLDDGSDVYAVKVTDTSYESKQKVNDRVFNITINLEYSYQDIRQRG